jgi:hypothetical protein
MTKDELTALADSLDAFNAWRRGKEKPDYDPEPFQIGLDIDAAAGVIRAYANQSKAIADIAPWLSASLESMTPCQEYRDACEQVFSVDITRRP